jgi:hypothetical protein
MGKGDAACRPVEQARADPCFKLLYGRGNGRPRQAKCIGGLREARAFGDAGKDAEEINSVHVRSIVLCFRTVMSKVWDLSAIIKR